MERILVIGSGGHARSLIDTLERQNNYQIAGYVVSDKDVAHGTNYPVIGTDDDLDWLFQSGIRNAIIGIGYLGKSDIRERLYVRLKNIGFIMPIVCDPSAIIAKNVIIDEGTFVGKNVVINSGTRIGKNVILNTAAIVEHDCLIDDFSHLSVGGIICGGVTVGSNSLVGANATVIQEISIGKNVIVGAGAVVNNNLPDSCTAVGIPARIISYGRKRI